MMASDQASQMGWQGPEVVSGGLAARLDAAGRLGVRPLALYALHRAAARAPTPPAPPRPPFLAAPRAALPAIDWHGPFSATRPGFGMDLFGPGDVRPVWEAGRLGDLPGLVARGDLPAAEALVTGFVAANPPFQGPHWACGQETALRAMHLCLALTLAGREPMAGMRELLRASAARIEATPFYAPAQDNNHPISEAAGRFAIALLLRQPTAAPARILARHVARLVAPDGGFAQVSPGYHRLLLDVLAVAEWLRQRHGAPPFPRPLADRAAAATRWLLAVTDAGTGATPRLGLEDDSAFADLSGAGPRDARPSLERAARIFCAASAGVAGDPGCAALGLGVPSVRLLPPARLLASGSQVWREAGALGVLRSGPLRTRPGQSDLLHLTLLDRGREVLRDGGTGAYNPPADWWWSALAGAAAHNAPVFDDAEPMRRAGRFLLADWPTLAALPDGARLRDRRGNQVERRVMVQGRRWTVTDGLTGPFAHLAWRWRLPPGAWALTEDGVSGPALSIAISADAPFRLALESGFESPAYGRIAPAPVLLVRAAAPITRMTTRILLPA
jgi:hypothetical protein